LVDAKAVETDLAKQVTDSKANGNATATTPELEKKFADAQKAVKSKAIEVNAAKATFDSLDSKLKDAQRIILTASSKAKATDPAGSPGSRDATAIGVVSAHVEAIVKAVIGKDYTKDVCLDALLSKDGDEYINSLTVELILPLCFIGTDESGKLRMDKNVLESIRHLARERSTAIEAANAREKTKAQSK